MTTLDWLLVLLINGSIILYGFYLARGTHSSSEWFLAARSLPWWAVGLSMFATNVDNADLVGVTGMTFNEGIHVISVYALGSAMGGILAAYFIVPEISRCGFYTNAEYLEARYGPATRIISALIQIQYRTSMLGMMIWSTYLVLTRLVEISPMMAWSLIILLVILAGIYTAWGGLKSVVWTDSAQGIVMIVASCVIFFVVWNAVGGWSGLEDKLATMKTVDGKSKSDLLHIGKYRGDNGVISPWLIALGWMIIGSGYWTVNHTQTMRLMGTRSIRDMKLAALFGVTLSLPVMIVSACLGVLAHGIDPLPTMETADELYPMLANQFLGPGLKGLVVAGVVAAVVSTFDSMGSALSAIFTRDVYARLIARDRSDAHYVLVGRLATGGVLLIGFAYLPFIWKQEHMLKAFTTLIPVFVTPLFVIYLAGIFTRVHRRSGIVGLITGGLYGVIALIDRQFYDMAWLPIWLTERWIALSWSIGFTLLPMVLMTFAFGKADLQSDEEWQESGWLQRSRDELPAFHDQGRTGGWGLNLAAIVLLGVCAWVTFDLFW
ncbi:MAG: sodium/solute symporter [Planctomycetaceae bacterium]|jgi:solute:Na+ symporter, SSS family|nr:sodium/solute symporter [Planctomycetaceae bacterium]MDG2390074.1 sodium/solute symporter [Planctomycetaceae bacterium]